MTELKGAAKRKYNFIQAQLLEGKTETEAIEAWKQLFKTMGSTGGKNSTFRGFRDVPGLARRAGETKR